MGTLDARDVSHLYGDVVTLRDLCLTLDSGVTALLGVNGAGKSTLLQVLAGGLRPSTGNVMVMGSDLYRRGSRRVALEAVALMPQQVAFPGSLTVTEVVEHLGWLRGLSRSEARRRTAEVIEQVGLSSRRRTAMKKLSGGMVRRVALAQALVSEPRVLLLDEPSTGLDPEQRRSMIDLVASLTGTVLFSSHIVEDVHDVAERVLVLEQGEIVFDDSLARLEEIGIASLPSASRKPAEAGFLHVLASHRRSQR